MDILTEVAQALRVNENLSVMEAAMLLMRPGGIIVKNEDEGKLVYSNVVRTNKVLHCGSCF